MKKAFYLLVAYCLLFATNGCKYTYKFETQTINNEFSVSVPDYLSKVDNLKPGAEFQYSNRFRNTYSVIFSEKKTKAFPTFYSENLKVIKSVLEKPTVSDSSTVEVGGTKGIHTELYGKMQGELIYYSVLTLESTEKYYQFCIWTRGEDRKLKYGDDIQKMLLSFQLLAAH
jgi:hypothetical protein